jgi:2-iminoacetate synthase
MYSEQFSFANTLKDYNHLCSHLSIDNPFNTGSPYSLFSDLTDFQLENLAQESQRLTRQRFGHVMRFFIPLYLSNECFNNCTYCGFSYNRKIDRYTLSDSEIESNVTFLSNRGFKHILLLTGESAKNVEMSYFKRVLPIIKPHVSQLGMEVQPLDTNEYAELIQLGLDSITVYQETYHKDHYLIHHLSGKKRRFEYRLDTADRACQAGIARVNIGALLGLSDWRYEAISLVDHLRYLYKRYWKTSFSISFPRITSIFDDTRALKPVSDRTLVQLVCAFRYLFPDLGITLSTREKAALRNGLFKLGITDISAESITSPGAYTGIDAEEQFSVSDDRTLHDICIELKSQGLDPVLKDWDQMFTPSQPLALNSST